MDKNSVRIVFMGTPEFAVESLRALVEGGYNVVGVVTMPDKPIGRHGSVLQGSPVKQYAVEHGLTVLQPQKLKDEVFLEAMRELDAQLQIVVAFRMLPEVVWAMPPLGTFNLHASLLPQYRGAAPINWAIINGEKETGITTFFLKHEIDTGEVIQQVKVPILDTDNVGDVHDRLMKLGADLVTQTVDSIIDGSVRTIPQELIAGRNASLRPAPKIFHDTCRIDWKNLNTKQAYDFIRGLSPYPAAWTTMVAGDKVLEMKIYETRKLPLQDNNKDHVGTLLTDGRTYLRVRLSDGVIDILTLQLAGKKRMDVTAFLNGFKVEEGMRLE